MHPGGGIAFSLGLWSQGLVQRLGNVLSAALSGVEEFRFNPGKTVLHVCRWQEEGLGGSRRLTVRALSGTVLGSGGNAD